MLTVLVTMDPVTRPSSQPSADVIHIIETVFSVSEEVLTFVIGCVRCESVNDGKFFCVCLCTMA